MTQRLLLRSLLTASLCMGVGCSSTVPGSDHTSRTAAELDGLHAIKTVFLIVMENHNWSDIAGSASAPFINETLLPQASYARQYWNPPGLHPSEPNYIWLEAGSNLGVTTDDDPWKNHQSTPDHLVSYLQRSGITWRSYQEAIRAGTCPMWSDPPWKTYAAKHDPMVFFDDVTGGNVWNTASPNCVCHVRPYSELAGDLARGTVARYNFITPDQCNDMHGALPCLFSDSIRKGDDWLAAAIPQIMASNAYKDGGAIFITWDESEGGEFPIGMIALSPFAKGGGYSNGIAYSHSSTLRTMQEIFGVGPLLRDAANATSLEDLFVP